METKKKVLIVEDDEHVSKVYDIKLKRENLETVIARDGEEGVRSCLAEKPDLVLLDVMLPKKDGFEVLGEIRKSQECGNTPVIILSNLGQQADIDKAEKLGANEYIVKANFSIKQVIDRVKHYLGE